MGLIDVLNGMQNGPHGQRNASGGGMSPVTMALLGLLAYKAIKSLSSGQPGAPGAAPASPPGGVANAPAQPGGGLGGGLGGLLTGSLGGLLSGAAGGTVVSGGLRDLMNQFQQSGQADVANSWVSNGPNKAIGPSDLEKVLDNDQIKMLMAHSNLSRDDLLAALSQHLPGLVNHLTPAGHLPNAQEVQQTL